MDFLYFLKYVVLLLLPIINPLGMSPIFYQTIKHLSKKEQHKITFFVAMNSCLVLSSVIILGHYITNFFHLNVHWLNLLGGFILLYCAYRLLFPNPKNKLLPHQHQLIKRLSFFPLTFPLTIGPAALIIALVLSMNIADHTYSAAIIEYCSSILGVVLISITIYYIYYHALSLLSRIGKIGINLISKSSVLLLIYLSISSISSGSCLLYGSCII